VDTNIEHTGCTCHTRDCLLQTEDSVVKSLVPVLSLLECSLAAHGSSPYLVHVHSIPLLDQLNNSWVLLSYCLNQRIVISIGQRLGPSRDGRPRHDLSCYTC
jgi:hypothetical protein